MEQKNIILIGYMGCGKTTIGTKGAKALGTTFVDTDALIEAQEGMTISTLFERKGEAYFRQKETQVLCDLMKEPKGMVLATGGGLPMKEENQTLLKQLGVIIYLKASTNTLVERLKEDTTRPLLKEGDLRKKIETMLELRNPVYEKVANVILQTDTMSIYEIICCLERLWKE